MTPKIDTSKLFYNRLPIELKGLMGLGKSIDLGHEEYYRRVQEFFGPEANERHAWETADRLDGSWNMQYWRKSGSAIYSFRDDLLQMFLQTTADSIPIGTLRFPYNSYYIYLGDNDLFPGFSNEYRIDGLDICFDWCLPDRFGDGTVETLEVITKEYEAHKQKMIKVYEHRLAHPEHFLHPPSSPEQAQRDLDEARAENIPEAAAKELARQQSDREKYLQVTNDIDSFDYDGDYYGLLLINATVIRKDGRISPLTPGEILRQPYLSAYLDFETHRSTLADAMDYNYRECCHSAPDGGGDALVWYMDDGSYEDVYGNVITPDTPGWRAEDMTYSDGTPGKTYYRLNNWLNVCNRPEYLETLNRLVFNSLCYLNWHDRDVIERYSDPKLSSQLATAPKKKQERLCQKAHQLGYRKLWYCGYNTPRVEPGSNSGTSVATHWRRGHWRNQPFGKKLSQNRLTWIKPVIVNKGETAPQTPTIYRTEK